MSATLPSGPITPLQKQLFFQASRRAMAEVERILERFIAAELQKLEDDLCTRILNFLNHPDPDIFDWLTGVATPPASVDAEVLSLLSRFRSEA